MRESVKCYGGKIKMNDCIKVIVLLIIFMIVMLFDIIRMENRIWDLTMDKDRWHSNYMQLWEKVVTSECDTLLDKPAKPRLR